MSRRRSRKAHSRSQILRYQLLVETLEERLPPGNMLSMLGDIAVSGLVSDFATQTSDRDSDDEIELRLEDGTLDGRVTDGPQTLPAIILDSGSVSNSSTPPVSTSQEVGTPRTASPGLDDLPEIALSSPSVGSVGGFGGATLVAPSAPIGGNFFGGSGSVPQQGALLQAPTGFVTNSFIGGGESSTVTFTTDGAREYDLPPASGPSDNPVVIGDGSADYRPDTPNFDLTPDQQKALNLLKQRVPFLRVNVNGEYGTPGFMFNQAGLLTPPSSQNPRDVVVSFVQQNRIAFGLSESDLSEVSVDHQYQAKQLTKNKKKKVKINYVYLQQVHGGIPVYGAILNSAVNKQGQIISIGNRFIPGLEESINTTTPVIGQIDAIRSAAESLGLPTDGTFQIVQPESGPQRTMIVSNPQVSQDEIPVKLMYLPIQPGQTRLVWNVTINVPRASDQWFEMNIDATTGEVWNRVNYVDFDRYRVLPIPKASPQDGNFKRVNNPADSLPSPFGWHNIDRDPAPEFFDTRGNNVFAQEDRDGDDTNGRRPIGGANLDFNIKFDPSRDAYEAGPPAFTQNMFAGIVNLFYWNNVLHDVLYYYGFTEAAGNFQVENFGRGGRDSDPVFADAQDDADAGTRNNATFATPPDGTPGRMSMFVWDLHQILLGPVPTRDSALTPEVIAHEYGHGLSNRLVAGPNFVGALGGVQSAAMGEGWSDYVALFFTQKKKDEINDRYPLVTYLAGHPENGLGIRRLPYSVDKSKNPLTYNDIDPVQIDVSFPLNPPLFPSLNPPDQMHNAGEIWAQTLWDMHWFLTQKYGFSKDLYRGGGGNNIAMRLVAEGMRLTPADPTFLDGRDAILAADIALFGGANCEEIWRAFARRGMGEFANDGGDTDSTSVGEDFTRAACFGGGGGGGGSYPGFGQNDDQFEPNETGDQAYNFGTLSQDLIQGGLAIISSTPQDRDFFRFQVSSKGKTKVRIDMGPGAGDLDLRVYLRRSDGSLDLIKESTRRKNGGKEKVKFKGRTDQTYIVQVIGFNGATGNYGLTIKTP